MSYCWFIHKSAHLYWSVDGVANNSFPTFYIVPGSVPYLPPCTREGEKKQHEQHWNRTRPTAIECEQANHSNLPLGRLRRIRTWFVDSLRITLKLNSSLPQGKEWFLLKLRQEIVRILLWSRGIWNSASTQLPASGCFFKRDLIGIYNLSIISRELLSFSSFNWRLTELYPALNIKQVDERPPCCVVPGGIGSNLGTAKLDLPKFVPPHFSVCKS